MSRLITLMYHRVVERADHTLSNPSLISATPDVFDWHVRHLARHHHVVSLHDVVDAVRGRRTLPDPAVLITFDDAYRDFGEVAWPILREHGLPATVFVPTAYPDHPERVFWWDRLARALTVAKNPLELRLPWGVSRIESPEQRRATLRALQDRVKGLPHASAISLVDAVLTQIQQATGARAAAGESHAETPPAATDNAALVLGWSELRELVREGASVCAHTRTHPALSQLPLDEAAAEIRGSFEDLRREIGDVEAAFAYPFGDHDAAVVELLRDEGVEIAFTTEEGHSHLPGTDPLRLNRTSVSARSSRLLPARLLPVGERLDLWLRRHRPSGAKLVGRRAEPADESSARLRDAMSASTAAAPVTTSTPTPARSTRTSATPAPPVAYVMSRFPKLTETFVLYELSALEAMGVPVEVFPLLRERQLVSHPEADAWVRRAHFHPFVSLRILEAHLHFLRENPLGYAGTLVDVLRRTWGSTNFFIGALGTFPKAVRFAFEMKQLGVRHVHAHFANHPTVAAFIVHRLTGIPYSFTAHGHDLHVDRRMLDAKVAESAFTVTVSEYNRDVIEGECGDAARGKVHVVHCGVDPAVFSGRPWSGNGARKVGAHEKSFTVACVASLEEVKGHMHLVEACRILRDRGVPIRCHLVGDGPLRRAIEEAAARAGVRDRIVFHGALPRPQVARLLSLADAAVLASRQTREGKREGIPVALMEAMAVGLPVVASRLSGIPELVEDGRTGFLVPPADPEALADALERLAASRELRERMGAAGRQKVLDEFDLRKNASKLLELVFGVATGVGTDGTPTGTPLSTDPARSPERGHPASAA